MPQSVTRTLRLDGKLNDTISRMASDQKVSVNFLVSSILRKYIEWDRHLNIGMVVIPRTIIEHMPVERDTKSFEELGRKVARDFAVHDFLPPYSGELSVGSVIEAFETASSYGGMFKVDIEEHPESGELRLALRHDEGALWSSYYVGLLDEAFRVIFGKKVTITHTDRLVVARIGTR
jgi:hypothetical protein